MEEHAEEQPLVGGEIRSSIRSQTRRSSIWPVCYSTAVAVIASFSFGYILAYSSPALSDLKEYNGTYTSFSETIYQDIFGAIMPVGALLGAPVAGWLVDSIGRKSALAVNSLPLAIGWVLIILSCATTGVLFRPLLFAGRFVTGFGAGFATLTAPIYIAEISPSHLRGMLGASTQLSAASGIFAVYGLGSISTLHYYWLAVVGLGLAVLLLLLAITLRETPRWLIKHKYSSKALENMIFFRGNKCDVSGELAELEMQIGKEKTISGIKVLKNFANRSTFHPLVLSIVVMFFQQFCGINAVIFYAEDIFEQTKYKDNAALVSSFAVGGTELFGTLIGVILIDLLGRRVLLVCSGIGMFFSSGAMGAFYFLNSDPYCHPGSPKCMDNLDPLAIASIILYVMSFSIAWGGLPWLLLSEMLPLRVRGAGMGLAGGASWIFAAIVTGFFKEYQKVLKPWGAFWSFSLICVLSVLFVIIFLPETKGKSLEDIENHFSKKSCKDYTEFTDGELSVSTDHK